MTAAHLRLIAVPDHLWADFLEAVAKAGIAIQSRSRVMKKMPMTTSRAEVLRRLASELLIEANERGDQNWETVTWAVGYLLHRANEPREPIGALAA